MRRSIETSEALAGAPFSPAHWRTDAGGTAKARIAYAVGPAAAVPPCDGPVGSHRPTSPWGWAAMPSRSCDLATTDLDNSPELPWDWSCGRADRNPTHGAYPSRPATGNKPLNGGHTQGSRVNGMPPGKATDRACAVSFRRQFCRSAPLWNP